jgi:hypothetical protein
MQLEMPGDVAQGAGMSQSGATAVSANFPSCQAQENCLMRRASSTKLNSTRRNLINQSQLQTNLSNFTSTEILPFLPIHGFE